MLEFTKRNHKCIKRLNTAGIFLIVSLLTVGCGGTSASDADQTELPQAVESGSERLTEDQEENMSAPETGFPAQIPAFTAKDLNGTVITEELFAEKDLTVVNIWGTFCPPCIAEMPELGEWAASMPDNVQLVGLIIDIAGDEDTQHHDLAVAVTEKAGAGFTNIIANSDWNDILQWVVGVPTTLFVDKEGNLVGTPIVGADVDGYKTFVEDYLNGQ